MMKRKLLGLLSAGALIAGGSVLVVAAPASAGGNQSSVDVNIEKVVLGDDPGVAFPIVLTCNSETESTTAQALDNIELGLNDTDTSTVELKDGESQTVPVEFDNRSDLVTCDVTEDVSDANLPTGWTCDETPNITPDEFTLLDNGDEGFDIPDEVDVTVTNDCTAPEPATTTTTVAPTPTPTPTPAPAPRPVVAAAKFTG